MSPSSVYQDLRCWQTETTHEVRANGLNHAIYWMCSWRFDASIYKLACVLKADILSIWCKDNVIYYTFDNFWDNNCQSCLWLFNDLLKCTWQYCIDSSVGHFKFINFMWNRHFLYSFVMCFQDMPTNFCGNLFIFDRHFTAKVVHCLTTLSSM